MQYFPQDFPQIKVWNLKNNYIFSFYYCLLELDIHACFQPENQKSFNLCLPPEVTLQMHNVYRIHHILYFGSSHAVVKAN